MRSIAGTRTRLYRVIRLLLRYARRSALLRSSLSTAAVVGAVLNAFNEGPALWHHQSLSWLRILLNFAVPFLVASYSGALAELHHRQGARAQAWQKTG